MSDVFDVADLSPNIKALTDEGSLLLDVRTGEVLPATPDHAAALLERLNEYEALLRRAKRECEKLLIEESVRQGTKTLHIDGRKFQVYQTQTIKWDVEKLRGLLEAGLPSGRWHELVTQTIEEKVNVKLANQLAMNNPAYAEIIKGARTDQDPVTRVRPT
jgi:hypothetical protein